jgi:hypothetical protein
MGAGWLRIVISKYFLLCVCTLIACGCSVELIRYKHVVVEESSKVKVVERSTESNDSQGKPLSAPKIGLPTRSILTDKDFTVTIYTPVNSMPVAFLRADDERGNSLDLKGAFLERLDSKTGMGIKGYRYTFIVEKAAGDPMEFDVVSRQGVVLGHEKIGYAVTSRGYVWANDSL